MIVLLTLSILFFLMGLFLSIFLFLHRDCSANSLETDICKNPQFALLIPARDESNVIDGLLQSILNQTRSVIMDDVFVIVESKNDPTISICKKYGASVIVRKRLELRSKGYALMEAIEYLDQKKKYYDAYFILDADNVLDDHYLEEMEQDYFKGYGISTGYRAIKNGTSVLSSSAGLTYAFINEWFNQVAIRHNKSLMLSGTGFYIHGKYIREWGTYPFHSLTEDVELSHYATLRGIRMNYNDKALFYDEQPTKMHQSVVQRKRWIFGYFQNYFRFFPKYRRKVHQNPRNKGAMYSMMYGILEVIFFLLGLFFFLIYLLGQAIFLRSIFYFWVFVFCLFLFYFGLSFITLIMIHQEKEKLNIDSKLYFRVVLFHPLFLISYVSVFFKTVIDRKVGWDVIRHGNS